jgi:hypothetical protein
LAISRTSFSLAASSSSLSLTSAEVHQRGAVARRGRVMRLVDDHQAEGVVTDQFLEPAELRRLQRLDARDDDVAVLVAVAIALLDRDHDAGVGLADFVGGLVEELLAVRDHQHLALAGRELPQPGRETWPLQHRGERHRLAGAGRFFDQDAIRAGAVRLHDRVEGVDLVGAQVRDHRDFLHSHGRESHQGQIGVCDSRCTDSTSSPSNARFAHARAASMLSSTLRISP